MTECSSRSEEANDRAVYRHTVRKFETEATKKCASHRSRKEGMRTVHYTTCGQFSFTVIIIPCLFPQD